MSPSTSMAHRPQTSLRDHAGNTDARQCSAHKELRRGRAGRVPRCADRIVNTPCAQVRIWDSERVFLCTGIFEGRFRSNFQGGSKMHGLHAPII